MINHPSAHFPQAILSLEEFQSLAGDYKKLFAIIRPQTLFRFSSYEISRRLTLTFLVCFFAFKGVAELAIKLAFVFRGTTVRRNISPSHVAVAIRRRGGFDHPGDHEENNDGNRNCQETLS